MTSSATSPNRSAERSLRLPPSPVLAPRVLVLADDLIWSTRLAGHVRAAGAEPAPARTSAAFRDGLAAAGGAIVDLTSRAYDGLAEIAAARAAGVAVLAVGQHDDHELHRQARAAGADRVLAYRKLFDDGPAAIARWLSVATATATAAATSVPPTEMTR